MFWIQLGVDTYEFSKLCAIFPILVQKKTFFLEREATRIFAWGSFLFWWFILQFLFDSCRYKIMILFLVYVSVILSFSSFKILPTCKLWPMLLLVSVKLLFDEGLILFSTKPRYVVVSNIFWINYMCFDFH